MALKRSAWSCLSVLLVAAILCITGAGASTDSPLTQSEVSILQAHMAWSALEREAEMNAAVATIYPLYETDTTRLSGLLSDFKKQEALIPVTETRAGFANLTREMRAITSQFRNETATQMANGHGNPADLTLAVRAATANNPWIEEKKTAYWNTRKTRQLADFDTWVLSSQNSLDSLQVQGYDTAPSQRTLDVIIARRPDLVAAFESKNEAQVNSANAVILPLTRQLAEQADAAQAQVSEGERMQFQVDLGYRAVYRADSINADLTTILLDIGPAEPALKKVKADLLVTSRTLRTGNLPLARTPLSLVKKDLKDLSAAYRDIANSADLPPDLTATLRSMVLTLDNTANQMEEI